MNKELKFQQTDNHKVYLSSDFHLNHSPKWPIPIWKMRGFSLVDEMNNAIIGSVNNSVRPDDSLLFLGDITLNCSEFQFEGFISRILCQNIYVIWGNHNSPSWNLYKREVNNWFSKMSGDNRVSIGFVHDENFQHEIYPFRYKNLVFIGNYVKVSVDYQKFILSHYPIHSWEDMKNGRVLCYGHQHCENNPDGGRRLDVGWDRDRRPYSSDEVWNKMLKIPIMSDGGHH